MPKKEYIKAELKKIAKVKGTCHREEYMHAYKNTWSHAISSCRDGSVVGFLRIDLMVSGSNPP